MLKVKKAKGKNFSESFPKPLPETEKDSRTEVWVVKRGWLEIKFKRENCIAVIGLIW